MNRLTTKFISGLSIILASIMFFLPCQTVQADSPTTDFIILLDPGHGCTQFGATITYDGKEIKECDLNLKIAHYLKNYLEQYETKDGRKVKVFLTHNNDLTSPLILSERVKKGIALGAEAVISLHNNATGNDVSFSGSAVLVTNSHYKPKHCKFDDLYKIEEGLGEAILSSLEEIGLKRSYCTDPVAIINSSISKDDIMYKNGFLRRLSNDGSTYKNGDTTDWYGIVYHGVKHGIPSIIVEHAFLDNPNDYYEYLSTDDKLSTLAKADSKGIANYYELIKCK